MQNSGSFKIGFCWKRDECGARAIHNIMDGPYHDLGTVALNEMIAPIGEEMFAAAPAASKIGLKFKLRQCAFKVRIFR